jgi:hypothetical protein
MILQVFGDKSRVKFGIMPLTNPARRVVFGHANSTRKSQDILVDVRGHRCDLHRYCRVRGEIVNAV